MTPGDGYVHFGMKCSSLCSLFFEHGYERPQCMCSDWSSTSSFRALHEQATRTDRPTKDLKLQLRPKATQRSHQPHCREGRSCSSSCAPLLGRFSASWTTLLPPDSQEATLAARSWCTKQEMIDDVSSTNEASASR
mmetsp:Transcript_5271/g.12372  ORF Transcript_5271/g.12372 Transcript_5271/m.12372 type:complete len:136 (-) Transcript_5271:219-626(-)